MGKINLKPIMLIPLFFFFLPAFAIWIPGLYKGFLVNNIIFIIYSILILCVDFKTFKNKMFQLYQKTPFKFFFWTVVFLVINAILLSIFNIKLLLNVLNSTIMYLVLWMIPIFIYFFYIIETHISFKKFMNIYILIFWLNLLIGIFSWVGELLNIQPIIDLFNFFANIRILYDTNSVYDLGMQSSNYMAFGLPRLDNLFEEPSFYAKFLFLFLPLVYSIGLSKIKISENNLINIFIKRTIIPLTLLSIILTFSPMFLIFSIVSTIFYFNKEIIILLKRYWIIVFSFILLFFICTRNVDWEQTYISRIINVLANVKSFDDLILIESSLATRFISFYNQIIIFCKNILFGIGYSNLGFVMKEQLQVSPIPLTYELDIKLQMALNTGYKMPYNKAFVYEFLAENGILISSLFAYFYYRLIFNVQYIVKEYIHNKNTFFYVIAKGLNGLLLNCLFLMFYAIFFTKCNELYICLIIPIMFIFYFKKERNMI